MFSSGISNKSDTPIWNNLLDVVTHNKLSSSIDKIEESPSSVSPSKSCKVNLVLTIGAATAGL